MFAFIGSTSGATAPSWLMKALGILAVIGVLSGVAQAVIGFVEFRARRETALAAAAESMDELEAAGG
jgi:hypothetical protein